MNEVKYTVRINYKSGNHRFVKWCDEHWFESTHEPVYIFSEQQAEQICFLMGKHYIKDLTILGTDGSEQAMGLANRKKNKQVSAPKEEVKKSIFSLNKSMLK